MTEDELEEVDTIVVTAITYLDELEEKFLEKVNCPITVSYTHLTLPTMATV